MAATFNPQAAADQARNAYRNVTAQLGLLALDTAIPEALGAVAEKTVGQTREAYDRSKDALEASIATFGRSCDAAGWGAAAPVPVSPLSGGCASHAEKSVAQTREFYDRSNDALDASVATFEKTFDAAGQGAAVQP